MHRTPIVSKNQRGFTLIELLIVTIVLSILAAIVVFGVGETKRDAAASACKTALKSVELSAEAYNTKSSHYPDTQTDVYGPGALLKSWPASDQYSLVYVPSGYSAGPPVVHASGFTVTVQNGAGVAVASCGDL